MDVEKLWYEYSPYLYLVVSTYFLWETKTKIGVFSSLLLIVTSCLILAMRWTYRSRMAKLAEKSEADAEKRRMAMPVFER